MRIYPVVERLPYEKSNNNKMHLFGILVGQKPITDDAFYSNSVCFGRTIWDYSSDTTDKSHTLHTD